MLALNTTIVGYGKVRHLHAEALSRAPGSAFTAACERDLKRTEVFAAEDRVKPSV